MKIVTKGFKYKEVADGIKEICKQRIESGMAELERFGQIWGVTYDIAYRGNGVIEISNND